MLSLNVSVDWRRGVTRLCGIAHGSKNEVHSILHAHLIPKCPHADLFNGRDRAWLARQPLPDDERAAVDRHVRELDRLAEDLTILAREIAQTAIDDPEVRRLITITGVNLTVATGIVAAIGDVRRFKSPQKLVSYFGLNPRVRQSGLGVAHHGRISKIGRSHARAMLVKADGQRQKRPDHCTPSSYASAPGAAIRCRCGSGPQAPVLCLHLLTKGGDYLWVRPAAGQLYSRPADLRRPRARPFGRRGSHCATVPQ